MKYGTITRRTFTLAVALAITLGNLALQVCAATEAYDLLIQRSPLEAGDVTPNTGAHRVSANSTVTLTASPQPGYRFAYWLGDVADPAAECTTVVVNEPKIVIAVFHSQTSKRTEDQVRLGGPAGGSDALTPTAVDLSTPALTPAGATQHDTKVIPTIQPVHTPEPATIALLALGIVALRSRRR